MRTCLRARTCSSRRIWSGVVWGRDVPLGAGSCGAFQSIGVRGGRFGPASRCGSVAACAHARPAYSSDDRRTARFEGAYIHLFLPRGFRSDLASSPRISWLFGFRPDGLLLAPGLAHDWYYRHGSVECRVAVEYAPGRWSAPVGDGSRAWGDRLFLTIARQVSGLRLPALAAWISRRYAKR